MNREMHNYTEGQLFENTLSVWNEACEKENRNPLQRW